MIYVVMIQIALASFASACGSSGQERLDSFKAFVTTSLSGRLKHGFGNWGGSRCKWEVTDVYKVNSTASPYQGVLKGNAVLVTEIGSQSTEIETIVLDLKFVEANDSWKCVATDSSAKRERTRNATGAEAELALRESDALLDTSACVAAQVFCDAKDRQVAAAVARDGCHEGYHSEGYRCVPTTYEHGERVDNRPPECLWDHEDDPLPATDPKDPFGVAKPIPQAPCLGDSRCADMAALDAEADESYSRVGKGVASHPYSWSLIREQAFETVEDRDIRLELGAKKNQCTRQRVSSHVAKLQVALADYGVLMAISCGGGAPAKCVFARGERHHSPIGCCEHARLSTAAAQALQKRVSGFLSTDPKHVSDRAGQK